MAWIDLLFATSCSRAVRNFPKVREATRCGVGQTDHRRPERRRQDVRASAAALDPIRGPYHNEKEARPLQNGALPPDLSLIAKARGVKGNPSWWIHPFLMLGDIAQSYQEGGADYLYALLTGFTDPPSGFHLTEGSIYNKAFPGHQISMPPPLSDGVVTYQDGTPPKADHYSRDWSAFLSWAADPSLDQRKRIGWQVILYLIVTTGLALFGKKRIWSALSTDLALRSTW